MQRESVVDNFKVKVELRYDLPQLNLNSLRQHALIGHQQRLGGSAMDHGRAELFDPISARDELAVAARRERSVPHPAALHCGLCDAVCASAPCGRLRGSVRTARSS